MTRRNYLGSIASSLIGSFNSRNNDIEGYWAIGKLYSFANFMGTNTLTIDLFARKITPSGSQFDLLLNVYYLMLVMQLKRLGLKAETVSAAIITIKFNQKYDDQVHGSTLSLGSPYLCECEITDHRAKLYVSKTGGKCSPHDPSRESQRHS